MGVDNLAYDVIVSGHLCLDLLPQMAHLPLADLPSPGRLFEVGALGVSTGGAVSNTGLALNRLGVNVRLMAAVGEDLIGGAIRQFVADRDPVLTEFLHPRSGAPSSYTVVLSSAGMDRVFLHCTGTNATFSAADIDFAAVSRTRIFHLGYPPILPRLYADAGSELVSIYQQARASGAITSLDLSLPDVDAPSGQADWPTILARTLPYVDIFVPSIDEIAFMLRRDDFNRWGRRCAEFVTLDYLHALTAELLTYGCSIVGIKLGDRGLYLRGAAALRSELLERLPIAATDWAGQTAYQRAFSAEVVGTTGAGDSAYAGLLLGICRGFSLAETARWSCAVGACNVEAADATSGVQSYAATAARLAAGWPELTVAVGGSA